MIPLFKRLTDLYFDEEKDEILDIVRCPICDNDYYSYPSLNLGGCDCDLEVVRNIDAYTKWLQYSE